jgi:hypothetical protein
MLVGAVFLLASGIGLVRAVCRTGGAGVASLVAIMGALGGVLKGWFVFRPFNRRNVVRMARLESPRPWQFFSGPFFGALAAMITVGFLLGVLAELGPWWQGGVAIVDLVVGVALVVSVTPYFDRDP